MSKEKFLPQKVDPFRSAENDMRLQGVCFVKDMERLRPSLCSEEGKVLVNVLFGTDEQGIYFMRGSYSASLMLQCQRCMGAFEHKINNDVMLAIVKTEAEISELPKRYEPTVATDGFIVIQDVIEDELIIGLPIVPMHSIKECNITLPLALGSLDQETVEADAEHPFKVIESLRSKCDLN